MSGVAALARNQPPGTLVPDPFAVLIERLLVKEAEARASPRIRYEAVGHLVQVLCQVPAEDRAVAALAALRTAQAKDPASEVREAAEKALETLAAGLLAGSWPPYCGDPVNILESRLRFSGRAVDDESLRALVRSPQEPEADRLSAAQLLSLRGVTSAAPDLRVALLSGAFLDRDLALLAHALLQLDGAEAVKAVVEAAGRLRDPAARLYLAQDLAQKGEPALYDVLVANVAKGSPIERHFALSAVGALAGLMEPGKLQPDPVGVLIGQLGSDRAPLRREAARNLAGARYSNEELRLQAVQALRKTVAGDPAPEVKEEAAEVLRILEERSHARRQAGGHAGGDR